MLFRQQSEPKGKILQAKLDPWMGESNDAVAEEERLFFQCCSQVLPRKCKDVDFHIQG